MLDTRRFEKRHDILPTSYLRLFFPRGNHLAQTDSVERGAHVRFPPPLVFLSGTLLGVAVGYVVAPAPVPVGRAIGAIGGLLLLIGLGLAVNNLWISFFALPALLIVHFIAVLPEETYLSEKFGESYKVYLGQVRRYL